MPETARWLSATQLAAAFRAGDLTPVDVAGELLDAIADVDAMINAFCLVDPATTMAAARESAARFATGDPLGPLDGVPVSIKDLLLTSGWPTLKGSLMIDPASDDWMVDAPAVARLREAGAVPLGKVTTPEFGWKGVTDSPRSGITRNPWDTRRTSGGSSGGSAAAVAAGLGPLSVGTDGGGSVRIPAAFCGLVGFKPTQGRIPMYPPSPFAPVAHVGPIARSVADCALLLDVISGFDPRDWSALPSPNVSTVDALDARRDLTGLRVAYAPDLSFGVNDPGVQANTDRAVAVLADLGAVVDTVDLKLVDPVRAYHTIWYAGVAAVLRDLDDGVGQECDPDLLAALERHRDISGADYVDATALRMRLGTEMGCLHEEFDVLVTPTMPTVAFAAGHTVLPGSASAEWTAWSPYTYPFNLTGQPAITVPSGMATGRPVGGVDPASIFPADDALLRDDIPAPTGLQIVGARHRDQLVLQVAAAYTAAAGIPTLEGQI